MTLSSKIITEFRRFAGHDLKVDLYSNTGVHTAFRVESCNISPSNDEIEVHNQEGLNCLNLVYEQVNGVEYDEQANASTFYFNDESTLTIGL